MTTAHPVTRTGDPKVHLREDGDMYALCGRPAARSGWTRVDTKTELKDRCPDCVVAGKHLPHRPAVPIYPWNPRL